MFSNYYWILLLANDNIEKQAFWCHRVDRSNKYLISLVILSLTGHFFLSYSSSGLFWIPWVRGGEGERESAMTELWSAQFLLGR